jgi:hypothetical protein
MRSVFHIQVMGSVSLMGSASLMGSLSLGPVLSISFYFPVRGSTVQS